MMTAHTIAVVIAGGVTLGLVVWVLSRIGKALIQLAEALAAAALVFATVWLVIKAGVWAIRQAVTHWRTSLTVMVILVWWHWWGALSLAITVGVVTVGLVVWRWVALVSFDPWVGRHLRAWWLRWTLYAPKLPGWLHACGLSITDHATPVMVTVTLVGRQKIHRDRPQAQAQARVPQVLGVRSGASWDEVRVRLVARAETRRLRRDHPRIGLRPRSPTLPDPRTDAECRVDRFPASQPARRPSALPRPRRVGQC